MIWEDPRAAAIGSNGILYVVERSAHRVRGLSPQGREWRSFGEFGSEPGQLMFPAGIDIDAHGMIFVADQGNHRVQSFRSTGEPLEIYGQHGSEVGEFCYPEGVAVGAERFYVLDSGNRRVQALQRDGSFLFSLEAGSEELPVMPTTIACDDRDRLLIADPLRQQVQVFGQDGKLVAAFGAAGEYPGLFASPAGIEQRGSRWYVADRDNHRVQVFNADFEFVHCFGIHDGRRHLGEGRLHAPSDVAVAPHGQYLAVVEPSENRCQIFLATPGRKPQFPLLTSSGPSDHFGKTMAVAENSIALIEAETSQVLWWEFVDAEPEYLGAFAARGTRFGQLLAPIDLAWEQPGSVLLVADAATQRVSRYQLDRDGVPLGQFQKALDLTQVALDPSLKAGLDPAAICVTSEGELWIADAVRGLLVRFDRRWRVQQWQRLPVIHATRTSWPTDLAWDSQTRRLVLSDSLQQAVFVLNEFGELVQTIASDGGRAPELLEPHGVAVDLRGGFLIADAANHQIHRYAKDGRYDQSISQAGYRIGNLLQPSDVAVLPDDSMLVLDFGNHRCQRFVNGQAVLEFPNPTRETIKPFRD